MNKVLDIRSTEEILREQIRDLNALLDMKNKRITELEALITIPQNITLVGNAGQPHNGLPPYPTECQNCKCGNL